MSKLADYTFLVYIHHCDMFVMHPEKSKCMEWVKVVSYWQFSVCELLRLAVNTIVGLNLALGPTSTALFNKKTTSRAQAVILLRTSMPRID